MSIKMRMIMEQTVRQCKICYKEFLTNKYQHRQEVCNSKRCQHIRQVENMKAWRIKNPDYWKAEKNVKYQKEYRKI